MDSKEYRDEKPRDLIHLETDSEIAFAQALEELGVNSKEFANKFSLNLHYFSQIAHIATGLYRDSSVIKTS